MHNTTYNTTYKQQIKTFKGDYINEFFIQHDIPYELHIVQTIQKYIQHDTEFIDIGSNIGTIAIPISNSNICSHIHCIEMDPTTFLLLKENLSTHDNISLYPFAVSDKYELCNVCDITYNKGANWIHQSFNNEKNDNAELSTYTHPTETVNIQIRNYNTFVHAVPIDSISYNFKNRVSVIKIDVEGYETKVIRGAIDTIKKHRPIMIIEIWKQNYHDVCDILSNIYYTIYKIDVGIDIDENYIAFPNEHPDNELFKNMLIKN
jgi:FkbM family methyltransferase